MTAAARVTVIGGGGGAAAAARVTVCRLGLGRLRGRDELVGQDGIGKCEISVATASGHLKSLKPPQILAHAKLQPDPTGGGHRGAATIFPEGIEAPVLAARRVGLEMAAPELAE